MGWFSHRSGNAPVRPEQKWDYIQLNDFKSGNGFTYLAYAYLFISLTISIAVYAVDTFTAIQLLVFNKWSSEIQPAISFDVAKWIFSICIILSFVNLGYEHIRAQLIIRRGSVAESYLDNLAVRLQSVRIFNGKGWRRFLVFAELTKSKKGAEYIALFTYFSFQAWIRIIFCSGPRQVVNATTLYSVYNAKLQVNGENFESSLESFFDNIKALAEQDYQQALILSGMLFTLVIWIFSALSFIMAALFFVFFLWGWIPKEDGGLSGYCERKINKRLMKIVSSKVDAALADQEQKRKKAELRAAKKAGELPPEERKATLPNLMPQDDKLPDMPTLMRQDTVSTLPVYSSRPGTPPQGGFEMNAMRPMPNRSETQTTTSSRAPLLQTGAEMGMASPALPSPYAPSRTGTMTSTRSPMGPPPLNRVQTNASNFSSSYGDVPTTYSPDNHYPPMPQPVRSPTASSVASYGFPPRSTPGPRGPYGEYANRTASPAPLRQMPSRGNFEDYASNGRASPAPSVMSRGPFDDFSSNGRASPAPSRPMGPGYGQGGYQGYQGYGPQGGYPARSQTGPIPQRGPAMPPPQRNMTAPVPQRMYQSPFQDDYMERPGTAQSQRSMGGAPQQRQPQLPRPSYGGEYSDMASQRGSPGPQYGGNY